MAPLIRVIGSINADMVSVTPRYPEAGETINATSFTSSAGGKGANQAVACARLSRSKPSEPSVPAESERSISVQMVGAVGGLDIHYPGVLKPALEQSGVDISRVRVKEDANTGVSVIIVTSSDHENRICFAPGANYSGMPPVADVIKEGLAAPIPDIIVMQGEIPVETIVGILRDVWKFKEKNKADGKKGIEIGPEVIFNPAPAPTTGLDEDAFAAVDHLIMNETEADTLAPTSEQILRVVPETKDSEPREQIAQYYHMIGVAVVVITLGSKGAWYSAANAGPSRTADSSGRFTNHIPAVATSRVVDTTAAGDTFVGGYATHMARCRETRRAHGLTGEGSSKDEKKRLLDEAIQRAATAAARCVEREGAMYSIPWEDEV